MNNKLILHLSSRLLFCDFSRKFNNSLEAIHEQIDKLELSQTATKGSRRKANEQESSDSNSEDGYESKQRRLRANTKLVGDSIKGIKMKIPMF